MKFHVEITEYAFSGYQVRTCVSVDIEAGTAKEAMQEVLDHYITDPAPNVIAEVKECTETHFAGFAGKWDNNQFSYDVFPCEE